MTETKDSGGFIAFVFVVFVVVLIYFATSRFSRPADEFDLPAGATNIQSVGNNWNTCEWENKRFLFRCTTARRVDLITEIAE